MVKPWCPLLSSFAQIHWNHPKSLRWGECWWLQPRLVLAGNLSCLEAKEGCWAIFSDWISLGIYEESEFWKLVWYDPSCWKFLFLDAYHTNHLSFFFKGLVRLAGATGFPARHGPLGTGRAIPGGCQTMGYAMRPQFWQGIFMGKSWWTSGFLGNLGDAHFFRSHLWPSLTWISSIRVARASHGHMGHDQHIFIKVSWNVTNVTCQIRYRERSVNSLESFFQPILFRWVNIPIAMDLWRSSTQWKTTHLWITGCFFFFFWIGFTTFSWDLMN